jgi:hypothetical protein
MKRFTAALLALAAIVLLALPASASRLVSEQVGFRSHKATAATGEVLKDDVLNFSTSCKACMIDSMVFWRLGATGTTLAVTQAETTVAVSTRGWSLGPNPGPNDSMAFRVMFENAGSHGAGDSLIIAVQVSSNGSNWCYVNPILNVAGANPITATVPAAAGFVVLEAGGDGASYSIVFSNGVGGGQLPDRFNCWQWPLLRFIVLNEHAATVHNLGCKVVHWVD